MTFDNGDLDRLRIERPREDVRPSGRWIVAGVVLVIIIAAALVLAFRRNGAATVTVATAAAAVSPSGGTAVLNATGYVTARRQATVSAKITGKVAQVLIEEGMHVKAGQVLATLDDVRAQNGLALARTQAAAAAADLEETRVRIVEAEANYQRSRALNAQQIFSRADLDRDTASINALRAHLAAQAEALKVAQRQVELTTQDVSDTIVRAPFDGVVVSKDAQPGEMVSPISAGGGFTRTGICTIVDMDSLEVDVDVNESYINRVRPGQPVETVLDAYPDWRIPSHVITVIPTADRQKATVKVRIALDAKDARILPDMGAKVAFIDKTPAANAGAAVSVPQAALRHEGTSDVVYVVSDDRAERRAVRVASNSDGRAVIAAGVNAGDRVVVEGPADLKEGQRVKTKEAPRS